MLAQSKLQTVVCTCRPPEAENFYSGVLGLRLETRSQGTRVYDVGGSTLRVCPVPGMQPSEHTVLGFAVADLGEVMEALTARGVQWERFPGFPHDERGAIRAPDGSLVAWMRDPDGNLLSIVQLPATGT